MIARSRFFIDGEWVAPLQSGRIEVIDPTHETVLGSVPEGCVEDMDRAISAARQAFAAWSTTSVSTRADLLRAIAAGIRGRLKEFAQLITAELGMPLKLSEIVQSGMPASVMASYADMIEGYDFEEEVGSSRVVREPVGVVGCITPWNYPLHQIIAKVAPALAAGCTVVVKPSEVCPLSAFMLAEVIEEARLPPGVFNLVTGYGPVVGERLASHPEVDMVSFTGSTGAGRRVSELASHTVKRVALELGGKSASLILDDADFAKAVKSTVTSCYQNSGQTCSAHTRMLVPRERHDEAVTLALEAASRFTVGDPMVEGTRLGPLANAGQQKRVRTYIEEGLSEGAELVLGGAEQPEHLPTGFFVKPTIFSGVDNQMRIAQEEIFGPVLCIVPYDGEKEGIAIANDSIYGLSGAVWAGSEERAIAAARQLRTGEVTINGGRWNMHAPFGGYKQSGNGRELGRHGLEEFLEVKALHL